MKGSKQKAVLCLNTLARDCYTVRCGNPSTVKTDGERTGRQGCRGNGGCVGHRVGQYRGDVGRRLARCDGRSRRSSAEDAPQETRRCSDPAGHRPARPKDCATLLPRVLEKAGQLDILHANAGTYVGGDLVDADTVAIDRMLNLNVNVVIKNVHDVLPHMIERRTGDIIVTSSLAAHFPTPWEPVYASSKWAINCFVQTVRRQVFKHGIRVGSISPGPVISALLADWPPEKLKEAKELGSLLEASEVANVIMFMLTRPRGMTIRDVVMLPTNFDL